MIDFESRAAKVRLASASEDNSVLLVTSPENVRYLTGFVGSFGAALVTKTQVLIATDNRYAQAAELMCPHAEVMVTRNLHLDLVARALSSKSSTSDIWVEGDHLTASALRQLQTAFPHVNFTITQGLVDRIRIIKDDVEISHIARACEISTTALEHTITSIAVGMSERQIATALERTMIDLGAEAVAFSSIVATGPNSAIPHHSPTDRPIALGDLLKIDFGARVSGYHADCTRTFSIGAATDRQRQIHSIVRQAQEAGRNALNARDSTLGWVNERVTQSIDASGFGEQFIHGLGHGVGLAIHELPFFSLTSSESIQPNTVLTIEPGIYFPGFGGVRIEDTVVIRQHGYENLTNFSYELLELCI